MEWHIEISPTDPLPHTGHVVVHREPTERDMRYTLRMDDLALSVGELELLGVNERAAVLAEALAMVDGKIVAVRPPPEVSTRTYLDHRAQKMLPAHVQFEAITEQLFKMADGGMIVLEPKLAALRVSIQKIKDDFPK